jgi:hypothetical protein
MKKPKNKSIAAHHTPSPLKTPFHIQKKKLKDFFPGFGGSSKDKEPSPQAIKMSMLMNHFEALAISMEKPVEEQKPKRKVVLKRKEKPVEEKKPMKRQVIRANYAFDSTWELPVGLKLLTEQEMEKLENKEVPFSWWIRWNELHYYDADMKHHTLSPTFDYQDNDEAVKWPLDTEMWEDDVLDE